MNKLVSAETEQIALGTLLYDAASAEHIAGLKEEDFAHDEHQKIFARLKAEIHAGRTPSPEALAPLLVNLKVGNLIGPEYLLRLRRAKNTEALAGCIVTLRDLANRRKLQYTGQVLLDSADDFDVSADQLGEEAMAYLNAVAERRLIRTSPPADVGDTVDALLDGLDGTEDGSIISTGLGGLDNFIGGWARSEMALIAGRPSMGKSALMISLARRAALKGATVLLFSLEMPKAAVSARMMSEQIYGGINHPGNVAYSRILRREVDPKEVRLLMAAQQPLRQLSIRVDDTPGLSMMEIKLRARRYAEELARVGKRLDIVMIDHIGKIRASDRYSGNKVHETGEKSQDIMTMARELEVAAVAAHQLNRGTEGREDKRPGLADLRDSGDLEQDAHTVAFPYRAAYYLERQKFDDSSKEFERQAELAVARNKIEIIIGKCRNGEVGNRTFFCDIAYNAIDDLIGEITNVR